LKKNYYGHSLKPI